MVIDKHILKVVLCMEHSSSGYQCLVWIITRGKLSKVTRNHPECPTKRMRINGTVSGLNVKWAPLPTRSMFIRRVDRETSDDNMRDWISKQKSTLLTLSVYLMMMPNNNFRRLSAFWMVLDVPQLSGLHVHRSGGVVCKDLAPWLIFHTCRLHDWFSTHVGNAFRYKDEVGVVAFLVSWTVERLR